MQDGRPLPKGGHDDLLARMYCILASRRLTRLYTPHGAADMVVGQRACYLSTLSAACRSNVISSPHVQRLMEKCWRHQEDVGVVTSRRGTGSRRLVPIGFDSVSLFRDCGEFSSALFRLPVRTSLTSHHHFKTPPSTGTS
jgi:hypothetical protein